MTKTKNGMKWLAASLLLVVLIGAVLLSVFSTPARAEDEEDTRVVFRVIISPSVDNANDFARNQGWIEEDQSVRWRSTFDADDTQTDAPVFRFENPQLFFAYGMVSSGDHLGDYRNIRSYLSETGLDAEGFNPEIELYVLSDVIWCNDNAEKTNLPGLDSYQTLSDADKSFTAVPVTFHFIGVTDYMEEEGALPTIYIGVAKNAYINIKSNVILDGVNMRGACHASDADQTNPVYHAGYTADGALNTGRFQGGTSYINTVLVDGCTVEVKNGAGIYNGNKDGNATVLTRIQTAQFSNAYVNAAVGDANVLTNTLRGDQDTIGTIILRSGSYTNVFTVGPGKSGIKTTVATADQIPADGQDRTDVSALTGDYYNFTTKAAFDANDTSVAANWYHVDYNAGKADAYVTVSDDAVVDNLRPSSDSECWTGVGTTAHINVEGGTITSLYTGYGVADKVFVSNRTRNTLTQFGSVELNVTGGTITTFYGGYYYENLGLEHETKSGVRTYLAPKAPAKSGYAHAYGDLTVDFLGGEVTGTFYGLYNKNVVSSNLDYEAMVIHGTTTYNIGDPATGEGPSFNTNGTATFRIGQGAHILGEEGAEESKFFFNVYGGDIVGQVFYSLGCAMYYTPEINLYGGTFRHVSYGFGAGYVQETPATLVTEPVTGVTSPVAVKVTVDGATIGQYYGFKGGTTNPANSTLGVSTVSVLKSGIIGSIHMLEDGGQSTRMGATYPTSDKTINWITLGEAGSEKKLTIGQYYAASEFYYDDVPANRLGFGKLYAGNMVMATTVYDNLVIDPAAAFTAITDAGLKKATYELTWSATNSHSKSKLVWADYTEDDFTGEFYAVGKEVNHYEGEYSGKYAADIVLDVHGFDLETRTNDHLFGNVVLRHEFSTSATDSTKVTVSGSIYLNIEGTEDKPLAITRNLHPFAVDGEGKTVFTDTDEGVLINGLVDSSVVEITDSGAGSRISKIHRFWGDVNIGLKNVVIGNEGNRGYIHLMHTMQYLGDISISLDHCTLNGNFHALSNVVAGKPSSYGSNTAETTVNVANTLTDTTVNGHYYGGGVNFYNVANITNTLTGVTVNGSYYGGGTRNVGTVGADGTVGSRAGVWGIIATGCKSIGAIANTLTDVTINGDYVGGNQNSGNQAHGVTNEINGVTLTGAYFGACRASTTGGSVTNLINGLDIGSAFYGGNDATGTVSGTVSTTVTKFRNTTNRAETAFYAGCNNGGSGTAIKPTAGKPAIELTFIPEKDEDIFISGLLCLGSNSNSTVEGDIVANLYGGTHHSIRHMILGNRQTDDDHNVTGNITANIYGGNFGTVYLGGRNNTTATTALSTTGDVTLNLWGGSVQYVRKGYADPTETAPGKGVYVGGDVVVNIHTDSPAEMPEGTKLQDLVIRGEIDGEKQTYATDVDHPNTPYIVNFYAGDRTLYTAANVYTYADGSVSSTAVAANITADTITGSTLKIAPADHYYYPITVFGEEGYYTDKGTEKGQLACGIKGAMDWGTGVHLTLKGVNDASLVEAANGAYSTITYVQDGENATWVGADNRPNVPYGTTVVMDALFNVRVLFEKAKVDATASYAISYTVNGGEAVEAELIPGEGDYADYYYIVVPGIPATAYKSVKIAVSVTADDLAARTTTFTGSGILADLADMGENEAKLAAAIGEYADALNAFVKEEDVPSGEVEDVTDEQVAALLAAGGKTVTTYKTALAEGVTGVGVSLNVTEVVTLNYYLKVEETAAVTEAAVGTHTLANGELTLTEKEDYTVISVTCRADELATVLTLTVNGGEGTFNACPLSYAKALKATNDALAQAILNYAYYVDQFAVII